MKSLLDGRLVSLIRHGDIEDIFEFMTRHGDTVLLSRREGTYHGTWARTEGGVRVSYGSRGPTILEALLATLDAALTLEGEGDA